MSISLDKKSLNDLIKRFDKAPRRVQTNAMRSVGRAGANVIKNAAKAKAPSYLQKSIKVVPRKANGRRLFTKFSITAGGRDNFAIQAKDKNIPFKGELLTFSENYPAMWVEFGTYGNRDYQGSEPYSPEALKKPNYASGRSDSPVWYDKYKPKEKRKWIDQRPFMRPAINDHVKAVEKAMGKKLEEYLKKKGL